MKWWSHQNNCLNKNILPGLVVMDKVNTKLGPTHALLCHNWNVDSTHFHKATGVMDKVIQWNVK